MASNYRYKTVLLIDDSYIDNLISRKILENNSFAENIIVIDSAPRAILYMQECLKTKKEIPQVIFLDIRMPEMNGFDFLKEVNSIEGMSSHNINIYMLSSSLDPNDLKKINENKLVSKFIGKPLTNKTLEDI